jgi:hypothetical protein
MANKRIFWAVHAAGIAPFKQVDYTAIHGLQSLGMTTTFNLEQAFELGQIAIYENIEEIPDVEMTMEKVLDGYPLIFHEATQGAPSNTLVGRSNQRCNVALSIFGDTQDSASGVPQAQVSCSGMYLSSVTYTIPNEGNCTEAVTLVGNDKTWRAADFNFTGTLFDNTDVPSAATGVQRRENVVFGATDLVGSATILPSGYGGVRGISSSGTNDKDADDVFGAHIQNITVSADLGRDSIFELGRKIPYFRFVNFPIEVTSEVSITATDGDWVEATETGVAGGGDNLEANKLIVVLQDSTKLDLGNQNKLSNVTYGGGDAGGGQVTVTYSYTTFNDLTVTQDNDPG